MASPGEPVRGLSAAELAAACSELQAWCGACVLDVSPLVVPAEADDVLLVLQAPSAERGKAFLHLAPGGTRARVTLTQRRFPADAFARGPARDLLQRELLGARLTHVAAATGERRCTLHFATAKGDRRLVVELFGARGLWALLDAEGRAIVLSRIVATAVRTLRLHDPYAPPPPAAEPRRDAPVRFGVPVLASIDAYYRPLDELADVGRDLDSLQRAAQRALGRANAKVQGLSQQLADVDRADGLRATADMMLAFAHTVPRGARNLTFADPTTGEPRTIELDPATPVVVQAKALYEKARRLDDSRSVNEQRLAAATLERDALQSLAAALAALTIASLDLTEHLQALRSQLQRLGALPKPKAKPAPAGAGGTGKPKREPGAGENFRRFVSAEGYPLWVGRNNEQNDRLTLRIANGNDLWLHVGGGRPGSHVIVRLPKQKTASLETLLDAATLAVHFSKARGEHRIDVVYTQKKHVRKPKGLPAGAVVPAQTKTITVVRDEARLARLLASSDAADAEP